MTRPSTSSGGARQVHLRIRRLSIDGAVAGAAALDPVDFQASLLDALADRLGGRAGTHTPALHDRSSSITQAVADAVEAHVHPSLTRPGGNGRG